MDLFSHALSGAAMGSFFGHPIVGAISACIPDLCLGIKRVSEPPRSYTFTHSFLFCGLAGAIGIWLGFGVVPLIGVLSHILIDIPTHGFKFGPQLLYPFSDKRVKGFSDWEFFNRTWWAGVFILTVWSGLWIM